MKLIVRLTPKASYNKIEGWMKDKNGQKILQVKVRENPEKGRANEALIKLLAKALHIPQCQISLVRGATGRIKQLEINGEKEELCKTLECFHFK